MIANAQQKSVALFQEIKPKLLKLYAKYAQEHGGREAQSGANPGWPQLLTATGLKSMLYDCGIFCVGDTIAHDEIFNQVQYTVMAALSSRLREDTARLLRL
jgi:hypothetical protein